MGLVAAGLAQVGLIDLLDHGVLVALAVLHAGVLLVQGLGPQGAQVGEGAHGGRVQGLAAAVDTAAGAGHELHEVILQLAGADAVQHHLGVVQAGGHAHPDGLAGQLVGGLLDALGAPDLGKLQGGPSHCR